MNLKPHDGKFTPGQLVNVQYVTARRLANWTGAVKVVEAGPPGIMLMGAARSFWLAGNALYSVNGPDRRRISHPDHPLKAFTVEAEK